MDNKSLWQVGLRKNSPSSKQSVFLKVGGIICSSVSIDTKLMIVAIPETIKAVHEIQEERDIKKRKIRGKRG